MEVGSMSIGGSVDTSVIERGFRRIAQGFDRVKSAAKSFGSDMVRIGQSVNHLVKGLGILGTVGLGSIVGLAKSAPAVAPAMAKISVEFQRLSRIIGEQLRPYFESFSNMFTKFVSFVAAHPNVTKAFALGAASLAGIVALTKFIGFLGGATISASVLTALGYVASIGAVAYGGYKAVEYVAGKSRSFFHEEASGVPGSYASMQSTDPGYVKQLKAQEYTGPSGASISVGESRRNILLRWWDAVWS